MEDTEMQSAQNSAAAATEEEKKAPVQSEEIGDITDSFVIEETDYALIKTTK